MKPILSAVLLLLALSSFAQKKYEKAFIVTNNSDTIRGYINYVEMDKNPVDIKFKKNLEDKEFQKYTIHDIRYFEIEGYEYFSRWVCNISMDESEFARLSLGLDTSHRTDTVFLRMVSSGKYVNLYSYKDKLKTRFYIKNNEDPVPEELVYHVSIDNNEGAKVREYNTYQDQLIQVAIKNGASVDKVRELAATASYSQKELVKIVETINGGSDDHTFQKANHYKKTRFFIEGGVGRSSFKFTGRTDLSDLKFASALTPVISVGLDQFLKPAIGRVIIRPEVTFSMDRLHGKYKSDYEWENDYDIKRNTIGLTLSVLVNVYNTDPLKFYLGAGGGLNFSNYPEINYYVKYTESSPPTKKYPHGFRSDTQILLGRVGCVLNNKIEFSFVYNAVVGRLTENYIAFSDKYSSQQLRIGYLFSNKKK